MSTPARPAIPHGKVGVHSYVPDPERSFIGTRQILGVRWQFINWETAHARRDGKKDSGWLLDVESPLFDLIGMTGRDLGLPEDFFRFSVYNDGGVWKVWEIQYCDFPGPIIEKLEPTVATPKVQAEMARLIAIGSVLNSTGEQLKV